MLLLNRVPLRSRTQNWFFRKLLAEFFLFKKLGRTGVNRSVSSKNVSSRLMDVLVAMAQWSRWKKRTSFSRILTTKRPFCLLWPNCCFQFMHEWVSISWDRYNVCTSWKKIGKKCLTTCFEGRFVVVLCAEFSVFWPRIFKFAKVLTATFPLFWLYLSTFLALPFQNKGLEKEKLNKDTKQQSSFVFL